MKERERLRHLRQKRTQLRVTRRRARDVTRGSYRQALLQAGFRISPFAWISLVLCFSLLFVVLLSNGIGVIVGSLGGGLLFWFYARPFLATRAELRRREIVPQLSAFVDCFADALKRERDVSPAFWVAVDKAPEGRFTAELRAIANDEKRASSMSKVVQEIESRFAGDEVASLTMTMRIYAENSNALADALRRLGGQFRIGGSQFIRISARARSMQVMFAVILLLFIVIPFSLIIVGRGYFAPAFADVTLTQIMQITLVIQLSCVLVLERTVMQRL